MINRKCYCCGNGFLIEKEIEEEYFNKKLKIKILQCEECTENFYTSDIINLFKIVRKENENNL